MSCTDHLRRWAPLLLSLLLCACGGGGGGNGNSGSIDTQSIAGTSIAGGNVLPVAVNSGIFSATSPNIIYNRLYASATLCNTSGTNCVTLNNLLVDTGSVGVRVISTSAIAALGLSAQTSGGAPLMNCVQFLDGSSLWGSTKIANVKLGNLTAAAIPIQVIGDPTTPYADPSSCGSSQNAITSAYELGANGILGLGTSTADCGTNCAPPSGSGTAYYYTCTGNGGTSGCTAVQVAVSQQVQNPVPHFPTDNNGLVVVLPSVTTQTQDQVGAGPYIPGAASVTGSVVFGVGTESNNQVGNATVLPIANTGYISTSISSASPAFGPLSLADSFLDTGSNGLYFSTGAATGIPTDSQDYYYTPSTPVSISATLSGASGPSTSFSFQVTDTSNVTTGTVALPTMAGPMDNSSFDWGLPFFYGRSVFVGIEGLSASHNGGTITGPYYAF